MLVNMRALGLFDIVKSTNMAERAGHSDNGI